MTQPDQEYITLARIAKPQGRRGEVIADLFTSFPEKFAERRRLFVWDGRETRRESILEDHWLHKGRVVLKFSGVHSISDAEGLTGWEVQIPRSECAKLEGSVTYIDDLIGSVLIDSARSIGTIRRVESGAGDAPLLVIESEGREKLVPFAEEFVVKIDVAAKRVEMKLPVGLLEIDAPLAQEEKARMREEQD